MDFTYSVGETGRKENPTRDPTRYDFTGRIASDPSYLRAEKITFSDPSNFEQFLNFFFDFHFCMSKKTHLIIHTEICAYERKFMGGGWCLYAEVGGYRRKLALIGGSWCL